ncbi:MAG: TonB C-terminal domain-containing protein [Desulfuromonadales bacterium]
MSVVPLRQNNTFHKDPKFGRLLLVSLIAHVLVLVVFSVDLFGTKVRYKPPVYYVDLIHKPVLNPQAGRPDPRPVSKPKPEPVKPAAQTVTPAVPREPVKPEVKPLVKPTPAAEPKPKPKPEEKPVPKPTEKPVAKPVQAKEQKLQSALDEIRERQAREAEREALKDKLAKLRDSVGAAATVPADVPVGMPDGQGDEVGVSALAFVQAFIQQNWILSPYLLDQSRIADFEAVATLNYSASGSLTSYSVDRLSGNKQFDDSLKTAIVKSKQLPQPLPKELKLVVTFNLKDIAAARR